MQEQADLKYRIIYESLSKFSANLLECEKIEDVSFCLQKDIKYLFNFCSIRFTFFDNDAFLIFDFSNNSNTWEISTDKKFLAYEKYLLNQPSPAYFDTNNIYSPEIFNDYHKNLAGTHLWSWNYTPEEGKGILVSLFSNDYKLFTKKDIPILSIVTKNLYSKILTLKLIKQLAEKTTDLEKALDEVKIVNFQIQDLLSKREDVIQQRTLELDDKNKKLRELCELNAHQVREPLSRILGLIALITNCEVAVVKQKIIPMLVQSTNDLDKWLRQVIVDANAEFN